MPALTWWEPAPDGLAVMMPADGEVVTLAGHRLEGDGVVFVKCAD